MLIITGKCGNYMTFADTDEVENLIENLTKMMDTGEQPLVYGWTTNRALRPDWDEEYKQVKGMIANDLIMKARQGPTPPSSSGQDT